MGDVLAVQGQLDTIQSQIEQLQGQLARARQRDVLLGPDGERSAWARRRHAESRATTSGSVIRAWHDSIGGFVAGVDGVVRVAGPLIFALLCLGVVLVGGRALWRRCPAPPPLT